MTITYAEQDLDTGLDATLILEPNYTDRTLEVDYLITDAGVDSLYEGLVGGEFFDTFEMMLGDYEDGRFENLESGEGENTFDVGLMYLDEEKVEVLSIQYTNKSEIPAEADAFRELIDELSVLLLTEAQV